MIKHLAFAGLLLAAATGHSNPWPYQHIDKRDGLSNSAITSIYMDLHDYVWFGTWDGLNRYDGTTVKVYKPDPFNRGTISNNIVRDFLEDKQGNLWVVTHKGINKYDGDTDTFEPFQTSLNGSPFQEYSLRACLGPDSAVWTTFIGQGISRYEAAQHAFVPVTFRDIDADWLKNVAGMGSHQGLLYLLGTDGTLFCTLNNKPVFRKKLAAPGAIRLHRFFRIGHTAYLAVSTRKGLSLINLSDLASEPQVLQLSAFPVSSISENKDHTAVWVGTEAGDIYRVTASAPGEFTAENMAAYFPQFAQAQRKILTITETRQDILWVGTDGDGLFKFLTRNNPFRSIVAGPASGGNLSNSIVRSVLQDTDGTLYVGTRSGGLNILRPAQREMTVLNTAHGLSNNTVLSLRKDHSDNLWIGTDGEGIDMLEKNTGRIRHFPRDFENAPALTFGNVYAICIDAYGGLWLGTSGHGVVHLVIEATPRGTYRLASHRQITYGNASQEQATINSNVVYTIVEETPNILWFGTRGAGIYRYNSLADKIEEHIHTGAGTPNRLSNDDVLSLFLGSKEELWIGTSGGLNRISLHRRPYHNLHYTQHDGLPNNTIHGIQEDYSGAIWVSTNNGLVLFDPVRGSFKGFDANDGLQNHEYTDGASFHAAGTDALYFGGINGLDIIHPARLDTIRYFPRLTLAEFLIRNVPVTAGDSSAVLRKHIDRTDVVNLAYDQNFLSFHFTTLDYWNKQRTQYKYRLENFDKDWNLIHQQSVINLTNIPPGDYTLVINYTNENGVWSPTPKSIAIVIAPPFWRTGWAYTVYIFLLAGLQAGIILYIRRRARAKRAAAIHTFRLQQEKELNDYKLRFFTNIAHEFRTPLTLILGPVITLIKKASSVQEKNQLNTIYSNSLRLQKLIDELIQFRKIESGKEKANIAPVELVAFTQEIVTSFEQHALEHDVTLEFIPAAETLQGWIDARKLEKILINLVSNAIKYNVKGGSVTVRLEETGGQARFVVEDSGIGIAPDAQAKIFEAFYQHPGSLSADPGFSSSTGIGLSLTRSLVQVHQGQLLLSSQPSKGSVFTVTLPVSREAYQVPDDNNIFLPVSNLAETVSQEFGFRPMETPRPLYEPEREPRPYSILVVDDNPQIVILLQNILADKYHVLTAANGREALHVLDDEKVDLVISDVLMPEMDGLMLCRNIKDNIQTSHIPVILLTAKGEIEDRIEGLQVGADSYIPKPFHPEHLFIRIEKLIKTREQARKRFANLADVELGQLSTGVGEKDDEFFGKITACIQRHLNDPEFTADVISDEIGMSKASLYKKVKALTNQTPHGLIKQYRLRKAADLLKDGSMSVSEVIYETGFNSRSYFYKSFNEMFHCHPKDFGRTTSA
ncbi:hybrid sensor histidine kinase/response regulator transcription factor [Dawidia soli]|uniref:histidine kinase n=1 Tax=Dawidia soli TaxID=2782352 RepID=A0AAP2GE50_9BACT|nr:two-component regulator propeller domain-containing protein [Dawidia soli]MBT1687982.1 response regulator [Dawidia soli]